MYKWNHLQNITIINRPMIISTKFSIKNYYMKIPGIIHPTKIQKSIWNSTPYGSSSRKIKYPLRISHFWSLKWNPRNPLYRWFIFYFFFFYLPILSLFQSTLLYLFAPFYFFFSFYLILHCFNLFFYLFIYFF